MNIAVYDDSIEAYEDQQETIDTLLSALREITQIKDPKSGDRGPIRFARHIALCVIAAVDETAQAEAAA